MKFLFFLVHPAKFHFHKVQINVLKKRGHQVDVLITKKDILEELVLSEGWDYTNIYPEGRKIKYLHVYLAAVISIFRTVYRLLKFTYGKNYDLFIGDLTSILGRIKNIPSIYATDDVFSAVPEQAIFFQTKRLFTIVAYPVCFIYLSDHCPVIFVANTNKTVSFCKLFFENRIHIKIKSPESSF